jgi:hypothetical protein
MKKTPVSIELTVRRGDEEVRVRADVDFIPAQPNIDRDLCAVRRFEVIEPIFFADQHDEMWPAVDREASRRADDIRQLALAKMAA